MAQRNDEEVAGSVAALMFNTFDEVGYAAAPGEGTDDVILTDVVVDGTYDLLALARAIVAEVRGA